MEYFPEIERKQPKKDCFLNRSNETKKNTKEGITAKLFLKDTLRRRKIKLVLAVKEGRTIVNEQTTIPIEIMESKIE